MQHQQPPSAEPQATTAAAPRWLGAGNWRARASPPPWLSVAVFKDGQPQTTSTLPTQPGMGIGRPATVGTGKGQRPLGAVRATSAHGAARRRARGSRAGLGHHHRSPTPEPPAGQGGYLAPSRGGRVTPQMAAAADAALLPAQPQQQQQQQPTMSTTTTASGGVDGTSTTESAAPASPTHTVVVRARSGRRYRAAVPPETDAGGASGKSAAVTATSDGGCAAAAETPAVAVNGEGGTPSAPTQPQQPTLSAGASAVVEAATSAAASLPPALRIVSAGIRAPPPQHGFPHQQQQAAAGGGGSGGVTSFSYMHFLNRPHDQHHQQPQSRIPPASPRQKPLPSYAEAASATAPTSSGESKEATAAAKPLMSETDSNGCTTEIFPIRSILKKAATGRPAGPPALLSASARPHTAGGNSLKLLHAGSAASTASAAEPEGSVAAPQVSAPSAAAAPAAAPVQSVRRPVRRTASMQNGQLSLRARSQSAGPKRGVRFDMTSNSVHEYEPTQPNHLLPAYTADTEHWYRLMWKRLAEH